MPRAHAELFRKRPGKSLVRIEHEVKGHVDNPGIPIAELHGCPGQPQGPDVLEQGFAGQLLENPGGMPGGVTGRPGNLVQGYRFGEMFFDVVLDTLYSFDVFATFRAVTSVVYSNVIGLIQS